MIVKLVRNNNQHVFTWDVKGAHIHNDKDHTTELLCLQETIHEDGHNIELVEGDRVYYMNYEGQTMDSHTTRLCVKS